MSITIQVFDPAMCCSTGICGPSVDPQLARFAADLDWLASQGIAVERFNLSQQPAAFAADVAVKAALEDKGEASLPVIKIGDAIVSTGVYPSREELSGWALRAALGTPATPVPATPATETATAKSTGCCGPASTAKPGCC